MKNGSLLIRWIVFFVLAVGCTELQAQSIQSPLEVNLTPPMSTSDHNERNYEVLWTEDVAARTITTATFFSDDGQIRVEQSTRPINYYNDENVLVPINSKLRENTDHSWSAVYQPHPTHLYPDGSYGLTLNNNVQLLLGQNCEIGGRPVTSVAKLVGNTATLSNVVPGIDKELIFYENAVKSNYILQSPLLGLTHDLVFAETIALPSKCSIIEDVSYGKQTENGWNGNLLIVDEHGETLTTFHLPVCYDAAGNQITGAYRTKTVGALQRLELVIPQSWLNDAARAYPVVVDPLVIGITSTWSGGDMPSCIMPAYNQDSILVTIPGGVTVTGLYVTGSFYADPFTPAVMSNGAMYFSTDCGISQNFVITGPAGASPGTAYLDSFNLYNPLTCCIAESCLPQNFYLSMHIGRSASLGAGCNTTYIRYDVASTLWPFRATVLGRTPEPYATEWNVLLAPLCSNECEITGRAYVQYGVPPYTYTHPWSTDTSIQGTNIGCSSGGNNFNFNLTIPNCPSYCDPAYTSLTVIPPTIVDACGSLVTGFPTRIIPIKMTPDITAVYNSIICSGDPYMIDLSSCSPTATIAWTEGAQSGSADIFDTIVNTSASLTTLNYSVYASENGCYSDTLNLPLHIQPLPIPAYTTEPAEAIAGLPIMFTDATQFNVSPGTAWLWLFGDGGISVDQNPTHVYGTPGQYNLCLTAQNQAGCVDSICELLTVYSAEVIAPNIITANNDGINDFLEFRFLEFFPNNTLTILNRWGTTIHEESSYENDWSGSGVSEGTYFYILTIRGDEGETVHQGFFQIVM